MRVAELWRFPVKSLQGEQITEVAVGPHGIEWDRHWAILDGATGLALTARREPRLLDAAASVVGGRLAITLPSGGVVTDDDALSGWLGRPVTLVESRSGLRGTYESPLDAEDEAAHPWVRWEGPAGSFHDSTRTMVSVVSRATIGAWHVRRFRQNVVVDGAGEDDLVGRRVRAGGGGVELQVTKQIDRCVMVTRPQPGLPRDLDVLRSINRERSGFLGVGCLVSSPGTLRVGDELEVV